MLRTALALALAPLASLHLVSAANADQWRGRLITDRFAPPSDTAPARTSPLPATCDPAYQTWCGGTWLSIIDKLDYLQGMGIDAVWVSPISQNIDVYTPYNYAYHGYWVNNPAELNLRFGSSDDLLALSKALHSRGMWLMVDIVVNNVPSLSVNTSTSSAALTADLSYLTDPTYFHPQCWIDYTNQTSIDYCWLGDTNLPLMDVNTENQYVIQTLETWIANFTSMYSIDGLRIDAAKHIPGVFWPGFCGASGVFCIGEVYGSDIGYASSFQTQKWMDAVLGYPLYYAMVDGFGAPSGNMSGFVEIAQQVLSAFPNPEYLGNFIENHDLPRWRNTTVDPQLAYNVMTAQFMFDGIPIVYYGQEQDLGSGAADPYNREALWPSNYTNTTTYQHIGKLNSLRQALISNNTLYQGKNFLDSRVTFLANTSTDVAWRKGPVVTVLTNRGSPSNDATFGVTNSGFPSQTNVIDVLSCRLFTVGADDSISVSYAASGSGGMPYVFVSQNDAAALQICGSVGVVTYSSNSTIHSAASSSYDFVGSTSTLLSAGAAMGVAMLASALL